MNRPFEINPDIYPFEWRRLEINGLTIHYIDEGPREGAAETIVCFHGNPSWSLLYASLIEIPRDRGGPIGLTPAIRGS